MPLWNDTQKWLICDWTILPQTWLPWWWRPLPVMNSPCSVGRRARPIFIPCDEPPAQWVWPATRVIQADNRLTPISSTSIICYCSHYIIGGIWIRAGSVHQKRPEMLDIFTTKTIVSHTLTENSCKPNKFTDNHRKIGLPVKSNIASFILKHLPIKWCCDRSVNIATA